MRKPDWLKVKIPSGKKFNSVRNAIKKHALHTVCEEALCPNRAECWGKQTATFMILGDVCTRNCGFCSIKSGRKGSEVNKNEPEELAAAVKELGLEYAVVTSVDRDDLDDLGAGHFAECIKTVKKENHKAMVEVLTPDFQGKKDLIECVVKAKPDVFAHNIETVKELEQVRDSRASYDISLKVLKMVKEIDEKIFTKSSIMLGLGERREQLLRAMNDLRKVGCDFLVLSQYLQPTKQQLPVKRFAEPSEFRELKKTALEKGFRFVVSEPLARTSYHAGDYFSEKQKPKNS